MKNTYSLAARELQIIMTLKFFFKTLRIAVLYSNNIMLGTG